MRSVASVIAAACLAACGNYSDLDIPFYEALPAPSQLHVSIPTASGGQALCSTSSSDALATAQAVGGDINSGIKLILDVVDLVKSLPPSKRSAAARQWGPWSDGEHPGFETEVTMVEDGGGFSYQALEAPVLTRSFTPILTGNFSGGEAATGSGSLMLSFDNAWTLGINKPTDPHGTLSVTYDFTGDPQTIDLVMSLPGLALQQDFDYQYQLWQDGHGTFLFEVQSGGDTFTWTTSFLKDGSGKATAAVTNAADAGFGVAECWDATACIDYLQDPANFTKQPWCGTGAPCDTGSPSACPDAGP